MLRNTQVLLFQWVSMPCSGLLDTSLTISLLASTLSLEGSPDLSSVYVVAYSFHFKIMRFTVLLRRFKILLIFFIILSNFLFLTTLISKLRLQFLGLHDSRTHLICHFNWKTSQWSETFTLQYTTGNRWTWNKQIYPGSLTEGSISLYLLHGI